MFKSDNSKSLLLVIAAIGLVSFLVLATYIVLGTDSAVDPTVTASYQSLRKSTKRESPLPDELTADFQRSREGDWVGNGPVKDEQLENLAARNQILDKVVVIGGEMSAKGLASLRDRRVRSLKVHYTELDRSCLEVVSSLKELERLDIRDKHLDDGLVVYLSGLPNLEELKLRNSQLTISGVKHVVTTFPNLEHVGFVDIPHFDDDCLALLKGLKKLREIDVSGTSVSENALLDFLKNEKIDEVGIADLHLDDRFVAKLPGRLKALDLSHNPITDASIATVGRMKNLESFRLVGKSMVTTDGLERLKKQLPECKIYCTKKSRDAELRYDSKHI